MWHLQTMNSWKRLRRLLKSPISIKGRIPSRMYHVLLKLSKMQKNWQLNYLQQGQNITFCKIIASGRIKHLCLLLRAEEDKGNLFFEFVFFLCRAFTAVEMRKKLHGKGFSPDTVESVIDDFQRRCKSNQLRSIMLKVFIGKFLKWSLT